MKNHNAPPAKTRFTNVYHDFLASIVVFLVALPLSMGVALASGAPVAAGLLTGVVGGLVIGTISGSPLQVSGAAAGLVVVVYDLIQAHGLPVLGVVVLLAGVLQLVAGLLRLGQWFRAVSPAVIHGMLAGIGILIFASQFHVMVDDKPHGSGVDNLLSIPGALAKGLPLPELGTRPERAARLALLQQVGMLHEQQQEIQELVEERVGHDPRAADGALADDTSLFVLVDRQAHIVAELETLGQQLDDAARPNEAEADRSQSALREAAAGALVASRSALERLRAADALQANASQQAAVDSLAALLAQLKNHDWAAKIGALTILLLMLWKAFAPKKLRVIPAPLLAVTVATAVTVAWELPVLYVEVPDRLADAIHWPSLAIVVKTPIAQIAELALVIALVASAETLLCATAVDKLHRGPRTRYDRELAAQGIGNIICGLLGALPMTGVIVRSAANVEAGARTRLSAVLHGLWLLIFVSGLGFLLRMIPTASLAAILVYTGYKLVNPRAIGELWKHGRGEVAIYVATVVTIVVDDLLTGVIVGIVLSAAKLLYAFSHLTVRVHTAGNQRTVYVAGAATFLRLPKLAAALETIPPDCEVQVNCKRLDYIDHACLELLANWGERHASAGGRLSIDWDSIHQKVRGRPAGR